VPPPKVELGKVVKALLFFVFVFVVLPLQFLIPELLNSKIYLFIIVAMVVYSITECIYNFKAMIKSILNIKLFSLKSVLSVVVFALIFISLRSIFVEAIDAAQGGGGVLAAGGGLIIGLAIYGASGTSWALGAAGVFIGINPIAWLIIGAIVLIAGIALIASGGCEEDDPDENGTELAENIPDNTVQTEAAQQMYQVPDPCPSGSQYAGNFRKDTLQTGNRYIGTITMLYCENTAASFTAYFKGESGVLQTKGGDVNHGEGYSETFEEESSENFNSFCYKLNGQDEHCFT